MLFILTLNIAHVLLQRMTEAEDLEAFIQEQKAKIAKERQIISKQEPVSILFCCFHFFKSVL